MLEATAVADERTDFTLQRPARHIDAKKTHELDKRSLEYVLRSGLAGGLAGCAVCIEQNLTKNRTLQT